MKIHYNMIDLHISKDYDLKYSSLDGEIYIWGSIREYYNLGKWNEFTGDDISHIDGVKKFDPSKIVGDLSGSYFGIIKKYNPARCIIFCSTSEMKRIYFIHSNEQWLITDDMSVIHQKRNCFELDPFEYEYYLINGYTTGFSTYFKNLFKMLPGEIICLDESFDLSYDYRIKHCRLYHEPCEGRTTFFNVDSFDSMMDERLFNSLNKKNNIAVLFSGGSDSTYVLLRIKKLFPDKNITPICFYSPQLPSANILADKEKASNMAEELGFKLRVIDPLQDEQLSSTLYRNNLKMPFDAHISFWHGGSLRQIEDEFDCIVTGQNADGIYNFGPTGPLRLDQIFLKHKIKESGIAELFKRDLFNITNLEKLQRGRNVRHYIVLSLLAKYYKMPKFKKADITYKNFLMGFLSEEKYVPYYNTASYKTINNSNTYLEELSQIVDAVCEDKHISIKAQLIFLKIIAYIQGADVRVLTDLMDHHDGSLIFFPYTSLPVIEAFKKYRLDCSDTVHAKKFIYESLKKMNINVFDYVEEYHKQMLSDFQVWHIINTYLYKNIDNKYEACMKVINSLPYSVNKSSVYDEFVKFTNEKKYNVTLIFRFLWSVNEILAGSVLS